MLNLPKLVSIATFSALVSFLPLVSANAATLSLANVNYEQKNKIIWDYKLELDASESVKKGEILELTGMDGVTEQSVSCSAALLFENDGFEKNNAKWKVRGDYAPKDKRSEIKYFRIISDFVGTVFIKGTFQGKLVGNVPGPGKPPEKAPKKPEEKEQEVFLDGMKVNLDEVNNNDCSVLSTDGRTTNSSDTGSDIGTMERMEPSNFVEPVPGGESQHTSQPSGGDSKPQTIIAMELQPLPYL
jgi:hypothetical protein